MTYPLIEEAAKKASIGWISVDGGPAWAVWCVPVDPDLCLVTGPGEQDVPGLASAASVQVTLRGDHGGGIVSYAVTVEQLRPESERWEVVAPQLAGKRLNTSGTADALIARWAKECAVWTLTPLSAPTPLGDRSGAAEVRPTPAANATRKPFKLHRVRRNRT